MGRADAARPIDDILSGISATLATITRFIRAVRVAHADLSAVTRELSDLRLLLELMRDDQGIPLLVQAQVLALLVDCGKILYRIQNVLAHCGDAAQWTSTGKVAVAGLRDGLEIMRRALGLVDEVVNLYVTVSASSVAEINALKSDISADVDWIRTQAASAEHGYKDTVPLLDTYLDAVVNCIETSTRNSPVELGDIEGRDDMMAQYVNECLLFEFLQVRY
ncbi:hypothetical protein B0T17DRAFT_500840 [Bombardia bombarda]|uniref:Fungal N-terminal domain-containing protein n=1 Tax=Bombardia bombarda TaxID=252184 RepID=A0AA39WAE4_9PEZI|nr:hypothetical protein B0T17DRAFT_500840 [Bombardia bombarda]